MDFSKTRLYQRTRSGYEKLYLEYNQKKANGRRRNGGNGNGNGTGDGLNTEGGGDRVTARVCNDVDKDKINDVSRRTRHALRGKRNQGDTNLKEVHLIEESEDEDGVQNQINSGDASGSKGKNVSQTSLIDQADEDRGGGGDGVELSKSCRKKQSKFCVKVVLGIARSVKENKRSRTKDSQQTSVADDDAHSYPGDSKFSKGFGRDASKSSDYDNCSENAENELETGFDKDARYSSLSSGGFQLGESEDEEGVVFLGEDATCLDDYDPSHSSRVESNEVKVSPEADADAKLQGVKSSEEEEDDPQKPVSPEEDGSDWRDTEPVENNAAAGDKEVISLSSSSDSEDGEKDGNAMGDDGSTVLEVENNDDLSIRFFAELLQNHTSDEGHEENDDCELPLFNCEPEMKNKKVNFFEPVVSKKRCGRSNEMQKPMERESKKRRTDTDFSCGKDSYWQAVDEKGTQKAGKITSKNYDRFGNKVNVMEILTDAIREEGDGDTLLNKYLDILPEENPTEKTQVQKVQSYKFRFEDEEDIKPEKLESEMEVDGLFDEMNMCLQSSEIGFSNTYRANRGDADFLVKGTDQATCCRRGKHQLTINDEFGIICRYCSYVEMEVRDILPPLSKNGRGGHGRHDHDKTDNTKFSDLKLADGHQERLHDSEGSEYEKGTVWDLVPGVKESMYPHQRDGFEFIWNKIAGGTYIEKLEKRLPSGGSGCIISHAPGTGKSRLTIVFLQAFLKMYPSAKPLIIAPRSMLLTWEEEFKKWNVDFPFFNLNNTECSGHEHKIASTFLKQAGSMKSLRQLRLIKLLSWKKKTSVLGITYRLFESLAGEERKKKRAVNNVENEQVKNFLLQAPTLLVLDEGHTPRNDQSHMWKALLNVKTKRSIILSGTPFQNNFDELFNTLCLVNPLLSLGISSLNGVISKKREWKHSSAKGEWDSITSSIKRKNQHKLQELRAMIDPFVHVHKGSILQERLPGLRDALVVLKPTRTQQTLLSRMLGARPTLENDHLMSLVSVHPSLVPESTINEGFYKMLKLFKNDPRVGVKTKFLMELINLSGAHNEKVLVFSQYIKPLEFIMQLLKTNLGWIEGRECLYMDGQKEEKHRQTSINTLNDPKSEVKVLLASLKACSEGINLVGASRVVLLDVHWNPSVERQAISRAYRLGQKKLVHVYHLVTGSMEGEKYIRQVEKSHLSELVFSSKNKDSSNPKISSTVSKDKILEEMVHHDRLRNMFEKVIYQPKEADLIDTFG
ncbi:hypothetical protein L1987_76702 [Smallanthus sonchifolius]|uniref:Uncharacterized protein n=1 Tax=Smallanthus sonchifolius TaxID=185202 RepID=A0ACB8Z901_9ASTR|nr:hypothetical protein L1987_76702 [Smallanthus sonchifolius]